MRNTGIDIYSRREASDGGIRERESFFSSPPSSHFVVQNFVGQNFVGHGAKTSGARFTPGTVVAERKI